MIFRNIPPVENDNNSWLQCNYFEENGGLWKTDGCLTNVNQTEITCYCDHATPFAILLMREPISQGKSWKSLENHWKILSSISYIGCLLSAFFTALSMVIYVFSRNQKLDLSIHVSLSRTLLLLNSTFLLTEWGATVEADWVCVFVAAFMHYSLLCCLTWMAIEALHLYLLLIKVINTYFKHYLAKLSFAGWDDYFFYSLNLVYFTLIFIFNTGILIAMAPTACKMKPVFRSSSGSGARVEAATQGDPVMYGETCRSILTVMGITCLKGTTWGLAFLGTGYVNYPILYLFCILNCTQGFFIFLCICLSAKKQRDRDLEERLTSSAVKTSAVKFD
ncbi:adhesion G-protein coupled receptor G2-like isoform 1-T4 [Spinachia spinachia]